MTGEEGLKWGAESRGRDGWRISRKGGILGGGGKRLVEQRRQEAKKLGSLWGEGQKKKTVVGNGRGYSSRNFGPRRTYK